MVSLPLGLAGVLGLAGLGLAALLPLAISVMGFSRLVWLKRLPHEKARLVDARQALADAAPGRAIDILQTPLRLAGTTYEVDRATLLSNAHVLEGRFMEAHQALNAVNERHLLPDERLRLECAWAELFFEAGNPAEARRHIEAVKPGDCKADIACLLLKAHIALEREQFDEARALLEHGLDRCQERTHRIYLLNNLASLEYQRRRPSYQLRYLQAAIAEFRRAPRADLVDIVHHNLAIALVRAGHPVEAKSVLHEAWEVSDNSDLDHAIKVLNNHLEAAREAGDAEWKREVHEEYARQIKRLSPRTPSERLALEVSLLRARRNDGIPLESGDYAGLIARLLATVGASQPGIPAAACVAALVNIRHDLAQELNTASPQTDIQPLVALYNAAAKQLLDHRATIDAYLSELSPKLIGPLDSWLCYRNDADKAQIQLADHPAALHKAYIQLFSHLRENAEWAMERGTLWQAADKWLIICDEYTAYHDELPVEFQHSWREDYGQLAAHALNQATALLKTSNDHIHHVNLLIGMAYFNLRLRNDKRAAEHWIRIVDGCDLALDQYAGWLREHYAYVCKALGRVDQSRATYYDALIV